MKRVIVTVIVVVGLGVGTAGCYKVVTPCGPTTTGGICLRPPIQSK